MSGRHPARNGTRSRTRRRAGTLRQRVPVIGLSALLVAGCGGAGPSADAEGGDTPARASQPPLGQPTLPSTRDAGLTASGPGIERRTEPRDRGLAYGFDVGEIKPARDYLAEPRFADADLERGELLSLACQACHTLRENQRHNVGPNLFGVFGRQAGTVPGFPFSEALRGTGLIWTPKALEAWLVAPQAFVVGNTMAFAGYASETDRRDLIAFLLEVTSAEPAGSDSGVE